MGPRPWQLNCVRLRPGSSPAHSQSTRVPDAANAHGDSKVPVVWDNLYWSLNKGVFDDGLVLDDAWGSVLSGRPVSMGRSEAGASATRSGSTCGSGQKEARISAVPTTRAIWNICSL